MKYRSLQNSFALVACIALMYGCATPQPGNDPVVVNAQATMKLAQATFDLIEKTEYDVYPAFKAANPTAAAAARNFVNTLRAHDSEWLRTAYNLTEAYRMAPTADSYAALQKGLAVLSQAITEANQYLAQMGHPNVWLSPDMALQFAQLRKMNLEARKPGP